MQNEGKLIDPSGMHSLNQKFKNLNSCIPKNSSPKKNWGNFTLNTGCLREWGIWESGMFCIISKFVIDFNQINVIPAKNVDHWGYFEYNTFSVILVYTWRNFDIIYYARWEGKRRGWAAANNPNKYTCNHRKAWGFLIDKYIRAD